MSVRDLVSSATLHLSRLRIQHEPAQKEGWSYLTPGALHWNGLVRSSALALKMVVAAVFAPYFWPSEPRTGIELCLIIAGASGGIAFVLYREVFWHQVRWNEECLERITGRGTTRIAWTEVTDFGFKPGLDPSLVALTGKVAFIATCSGMGIFVVASDRSRVKLSPHMNGVWEVWARLKACEAKLYPFVQAPR